MSVSKSSTASMSPLQARSIYNTGLRISVVRTHAAQPCMYIVVRPVHIQLLGTCGVTMHVQGWAAFVLATTDPQASVIHNSCSEDKLPSIYSSKRVLHRLDTPLVP